MYDIAKYKKFHRLNPKLRVSWSMGYVYERCIKTGDWNPMWQYLTGLGEAMVTDAMTEGKRRHEGREILGGGLPIFEGGKTEVKHELHIDDEMVLVIVIDVEKAPYLGDYKSGSFNISHEKQLKFYHEVEKALGNNYEMGVLMKLEPDFSVTKTKHIFFEEEGEGLIEYMTEVGKAIINRIETTEELDNYIFEKELI